MTTLADDIFTAIAGNTQVAAVVANRVYRSQAPQAVARPYVVWQSIGRREIFDLDGSVATGGLENPRLQVTAWAVKASDADALDLLIATAMFAASAFKALRVDHRDMPYEPDTKLYGSQTDFSLWRSN